MSDNPARWWRADGGFQDAPAKLSPPQPEPAGAMFYPPMPWGWSYPYPPHPFYGYPPGGAAYLQGPVPDAGLYTQFPSRPTAPSPPPVPKGEAKEDKTYDSKSEKKKEKRLNPRAPPVVQEHSNYMFSSSYTKIHVFNKAAPVWDEKYKTQKLRFTSFTVGTKTTVKDVIDYVIEGKGHDSKNWAISQAYEQGDGGWMKGSTINYDSSRSDGNLASMGWSRRRGEQLEPVWLVVHKVGFKKD